jgi:hypothetical protein
VEEKLPFYRCADFYTALVMFLFGGIITWQITTIQVADSRMLPIIGVVVVFLTAGCLLYKTIRGADQTPAAIFLMSGKEMLLVASLVLTVLLIPILGFYTSCYLLLVASYLLMDGTYRPKAILKALIGHGVVITLLYVVFSVLLNMIFPTGIFY